jgi:Helitron helicase-like domain at N-terminus
LCLTLAEKMLIALASPFIPLQHIKNGVFGLSGHVCCFDQDLEHFVNTLPRHPTDVSVLKVLKEIPVEIGGSVTRTSVYTVRKTKVGEALAWLKEYNIEYKHIRIDMSALDWLQGEEGCLEGFVLSSDQPSETDDLDDVNLDLGPSPSMTKGILQAGGSVKTFGFVDESPGSVLSPEDVQIHNGVVCEIDASTKKQNIQVQWPAHGPVAINEYSNTRIFVRAFPWLFPGGLGDIKEVPDGDLQKWGERLLYYEDGRFATDKYFSFYALNYITRHRNAKSGGWFIKGFNKNGPQNLEELKETIRSGNTDFVNRLMYFNKCVRGSTSYWNQKRAEVYSWVNHHVEAGHGPPNLFITLSCAEYYWPDVIRLIKERMEIAGDTRSKECFQGSPKLTEIINDYTVVVQEYFQIRFNLWMEHVGRPIFGIAHYWARYEFAPGRGQIHIHLLAIRIDQNIFRLCYEDLQTADGKVKRDTRLAVWAAEQFGLTASVGTDFHARSTLPRDSPCSIRLSDIVASTDLSDAITNVLYNDQQNLIKFCQVHDCNGFCLRHKGNNK